MHAKILKPLKISFKICEINKLLNKLSLFPILKIQTKSFRTILLTNNQSKNLLFVRTPTHIFQFLLSL